MTGEYRLDRPVALTCPECGGALRALHDGSLLRFECHIGHTLTAEVMLEAHFTILEAKLAAAMVALNERAELCRQLEETALGGKDIRVLRAAKQQALDRAAALMSLLESEWTPVTFYKMDGDRDSAIRSDDRNG
jgi:two-component system, chemotaxis family, protein-glutamate methylesterase/glutaminase